MRTATFQLIFAVAATTVAYSLPVGFCLHSDGPSAPAERIECFEFAKVEKVGSDYRFFLEPRGTTMVTKYRFRGIIYYKIGLLPDSSEFVSTLKQYEDIARATPSSRRYLNHRILDMRCLAAERSAEDQIRESLPSVLLGKATYFSPRYKGIEAGKLVIEHRDGLTKFDITRITDDHVQALAKIDRKFGTIRIAPLAGQRFWNPVLDEISARIVKFKHENGHHELRIDDLSDSDKKIIMSWSDGTWKLDKPGFYRSRSGSGSYDELVLDTGKFFTDVQLTNRTGESISLKTKGGNFVLPIRQIGNLPGLSADDSGRIEGWVKEIIEERVKLAKPEESTNEIAFDEAKILRVTNIKVKILQVLDEGVLASEFVGKLHKGTRTVRTTRTANVHHPLTDQIITKQLGSSVDEHDVVEGVSDDLCYIVGKTSNLVDGEVVRVESMRLLGRYQYTDVRGASRTVRKYHVD